MAKEDDIFDKKQEWLDGLDSKYIIRNSKFEAELYERISKDILPQLEVDENGSIVSSSKNMSRFTYLLNQIFNDFTPEYSTFIIGEFVKDFNQLNRYGRDYFAASEGVKRLSITPEVNSIMRQMIGLEKKGRLKSGGWLAQIGETESIKQNIQDIATRNITGKNDYEAFFKEMRESIKTNKDGMGVLNRKFNRESRDKLSQYDRAVSTQYATNLNYQAFRYSGGLINDSRQFCCERNRRVFLIEETKRWNRERWQGKTKNYSPLTDMGGYNCRHSPQWLTNSRAMQIRRDLKLDENGVLYSELSKPKLNSCRRRA